LVVDARQHVEDERVREERAGTEMVLETYAVMLAASWLKWLSLAVVSTSSAVHV
jgi:hypothetical protein